MPDLRNLETFVWVARLGGFRLAAEKLNTTQPAISARVAALEQEFGVRLFERNRFLMRTNLQYSVRQRVPCAVRACTRCNRSAVAGKVTVLGNRVKLHSVEVRCLDRMATVCQFVDGRIPERRSEGAGLGMRVDDESVNAAPGEPLAV